jgi:hypothetical protein
MVTIVVGRMVDRVIMRVDGGERAGGGRRRGRWNFSLGVSIR